MFDGMTNIKASEVLRELKDYIEDLPHYSPDEVAEALEMAIKALEQQLMRDATEEERKSVKDYIESISKPTGFDFYEAQPSEDCISRQAVLNGLAGIAKVKARSDAQKSLMGRVMFFTEQLPPVTPQRPKGKWIEYCYQNLNCSNCGYVVADTDIDEYNFCPNCGAYMRGGEDDSL